MGVRPREDKDATEIVKWAHRQSWSNGRSAMTGPSYMGISQIFAAAGHPKGLKAIFPQVPGADVYRDVVARAVRSTSASSRCGSAWSPAPA